MLCGILNYRQGRRWAIQHLVVTVNDHPRSSRDRRYGPDGMYTVSTPIYSEMSSKALVTLRLSGALPSHRMQWESDSTVSERSSPGETGSGLGISVRSSYNNTGREAPNQKENVWTCAALGWIACSGCSHLLDSFRRGSRETRRVSGRMAA